MVEFLRGRYVYSDIEYLTKLFDVMTIHEINLISNHDFDFLWEYIWMDKQFNKSSDKIKRDYAAAELKFNNIKYGYNIGDLNIKLETLCENSKSNYDEQEWGFPKGRRNFNENDLAAAVREFSEETNISENDIKLVSTTKTFIEEYKSYDNITYKNIYYLAEYCGNSPLNIDPTKKEQFTEISDIDFFVLDDAINKIRDYNLEKKLVIQKVDSFLNFNKFQHHTKYSLLFKKFNTDNHFPNSI